MYGVAACRGHAGGRTARILTAAVAAPHLFKDIDRDEAAMSDTELRLGGTHREHAGACHLTWS